MLFGVESLERLHRRIAVAALFKDQFGEAVARPRGRGRAEHANLDRRQRRIDVAPGSGSVGLAERIGGKRLVNIGHCEVDIYTVFALNQRQTINPDGQFDNVLRAILDAVGMFARLHRAWGVDRVGELVAYPAAEQLDAAPGAGRFDDHAAADVGALKLFGDRRGEGIDRRRSDNLDLAARIVRRAIAAAIAGRHQRHHWQHRAKLPHDYPLPYRPDEAGLQRSLVPTAPLSVTTQLRFYDNAQDADAQDANGKATRFGKQNRIANGAWILVEAISPYVQWIIFFGMSLSVIMIIYNGFLIITDPGGDKIKSAKDNIKNIIIGVLVLGGFYFIMRLVSGLLLKLVGG